MQSVANIVIPPLGKSYSYLIPEQFSNQVAAGSYVEVPLGRRSAHGFVIGLSDQNLNNTFTLKPVHKVISTQSFNADQIALFEWTANYYSFPIGAVIDTAIPAYVAPRIKKQVRLLNDDFSSVKGPRQKEIIEFLIANNRICDYTLLQKRFKNCSASLKSLTRSSLVSVEQQAEESEIELLDQVADWAKTNIELNSEQAAALQSVASSVKTLTPDIFLLHGVTGSGKTEVYIEAARVALELQLGVLIIVPEIALTPQVIRRFQARLGNSIAILHSAMSKRARWNNWNKLLSGDYRLAIGARSAVFAPVRNLGLIIVDEEHDNSYKQSDGLRYHARDLAVVRSKLAGCPVLLGSATPSLESFHNALRKKYQYLSLSNRPSSASNLKVEVVDLNKIKSSEMASQNISPQLHAAMQTVLKSGGQVFILYNRRGFASFLQCDCCGYSVPCPNCSVTLTYHQARNSLQCHYCNLRQIPAEFCPQCQVSDDPEVRSQPGRLVQRGAGTEKIFDEIQELFPQYRIARLDRDSVADQSDYNQLFDELRSGQIKVLVGTQMIAKGHDLPNVQLVGVADCDVGLHLPDFRSSERVFQLLTQAAGRAGRGDHAGLVILQTRIPAHLSITHTQHQNFNNFAQQELRLRKNAFYPPYTKLLRVLASGPDNALVNSALVTLKDLLESEIQRTQLNVTLLGPAPAALSKIKNSYRWHLLLKATSTKDLQRLINLMRQNKTPRLVKLILDRDPQDML